jgi:hypothetical protein
LQSWTLPEPLQHLRRLLEVRMGNRGKREFVQVLRLRKVFSEVIVATAALDAIRLSAISFDAQPSVRRLRKLACVKQLVITKVERRPARLGLDDYPYYRWPTSRRHRLPICGSRVREGGMTGHRLLPQALRRRKFCSRITCDSSNGRSSCASRKARRRSHSRGSRSCPLPLAPCRARTLRS